MTAARDVCADFRSFIHEYDDVDDEQPLEEFIYKWLEYGSAVVAAGGSFGTYLRGVLCIIAEWLEDPSILDFKGTEGKEPRTRRAERLVEAAERFEQVHAFDRDHFRWVMFRRLLKEDSA
jgi:hypothetical protein